MTPERWRQISAIFHAALARERSEREALLAASCGDDAELRRDVVSLLAAHDEAGTLGETPGFLDAQTLINSAVGIALTPGELFAKRYRIVSLLGIGGMGEVYRADDLRVGTPVALKFLSYTRGAPIGNSLFKLDSRTPRLSVWFWLVSAPLPWRSCCSPEIS